MTPCEKLGYAVGDRFEVITSDCACFTKGSIIELEGDDGSDCPLFKLVQGKAHKDGDNYVMLKKIKKLPKETPMNSLDTLIKARETYGQAKESLQQALEKVREDYPWLQIDIREDVQLEQPKDLPYTEWRKGDIVEFTEEGNHWLTKGKRYEVENWWTGVPVDSDGDLRILKGDGGTGACAHHALFKWISRGETK